MTIGAGIRRARRSVVRGWRALGRCRACGKSPDAATVGPGASRCGDLLPRSARGHRWRNAAGPRAHAVRGRRVRSRAPGPAHGGRDIACGLGAPTRGRAGPPPAGTDRGAGRVHRCHGRCTARCVGVGGLARPRPGAGRPGRRSCHARPSRRPQQALGVLRRRLTGRVALARWGVPTTMQAERCRTRPGGCRPPLLCPEWREWCPGWPGWVEDSSRRLR